jgi:uncharacterized protein DUF4157
LLDKNTQEFMESRLGYDLNHIKIHTDEKAADSAHSINASAYTIGQDIVFGSGESVGNFCLIFLNWLLQAEYISA